MNKFLVVILILVFSVLAFFIYKKVTSKKTDRAKPLPNWTNADWIKNGYTQAEFEAAKKAQNSLFNFQPFI